MMMMSELPEDLLEEILFRVPTTASLKRLRYTCKRWKRLFNDRRFARKLLDKAAAKPSPILVLNEFRICSMSINLHRRVQPIELIGQFNLKDLRSGLDQTEICQVSHCDGLLLCVTKKYITLVVVWNPYTSQTKLIISRHQRYTTYALGSNDISYKILSHNGCYGQSQEFGIYDINSNSWKILDVTIDFSLLGYLNWGMSLKGKTYWIARDEKEESLDKFLLVSFDYKTERFERLCLPRRYPSYRVLYLSVVREEKLSVLLQRDRTSETEIWVTNKIGEETKMVSWSMVFAVDLGPHPLHTCYGGKFWIDEEKKVLVCCDRRLYNDKYKKIHIVGEDNKVRTQDSEVGSSFFPLLLNYVPSLIQIQQN